MLVYMFRSYLHDNTEGGEFFWPTLVFILLEVKMYWRDLLSDSSPPVVPHFASEVYVSYLPPPGVRRSKNLTRWRRAQTSIIGCRVNN